MDPTQAAFLGLIQGITEWLPISSTGHLRIAEHFTGLTVPLLFDVVLHFGTLTVIFLFFRLDIKNILGAIVHKEFKSETGKLIPLILVGTIPTILIGFFLGSTLDAYFSNLAALGGGFILNGVLLYASKTGNERKENITYLEALIIGTAQGIAIIPSISRSGITIVTALLLGIQREKAFKFSFLLSIPSILGALGLTIYEQHNLLNQTGIGFTEIAVGVAVSITVGLFSLKFLWRTLASRKFHFFALYCTVVGVLLVGLSFSGL